MAMLFTAMKLGENMQKVFDTPIINTVVNLSANQLLTRGFIAKFFMFHACQPLLLQRFCKTLKHFI